MPRRKWGGWKWPVEGCPQPGARPTDDSADLGSPFGDQFEPRTGRGGAQRRVKAFGRVVLAFAVGAALGGLMTAVVQFRAIVLPVAAVALCAWGQARVDSPQHSDD